jgi:hypothetical protein
MLFKKNFVYINNFRKHIGNHDNGSLQKIRERMGVDGVKEKGGFCLICMLMMEQLYMSSSIR